MLRRLRRALRGPFSYRPRSKSWEEHVRAMAAQRPTGTISIEEWLKRSIAGLKAEEPTGFALAILHELEAQLEAEPYHQAHFIRQLYCEEKS